MLKSDDIHGRSQDRQQICDVTAEQSVQKYIVVVKRKDEPGEIDWSSGADLRRALGAAKEFLDTQVGEYTYTENDLYLRCEDGEKQTMTLAAARAICQSASLL